MLIQFYIDLCLVIYPLKMDDLWIKMITFMFFFYLLLDPGTTMIHEYRNLLAKVTTQESGQPIWAHRPSR